MLNKDYKEMLQCLLEEDVKFLLVVGNTGECIKSDEGP